MNDAILKILDHTQDVIDRAKEDHIEWEEVAVDVLSAELEDIMGTGDASLLARVLMKHALEG